MVFECKCKNLIETNSNLLQYKLYCPICNNFITNFFRNEYINKIELDLPVVKGNIFLKTFQYIKGHLYNDSLIIDENNNNYYISETNQLNNVSGIFVLYKPLNANTYSIQKYIPI